MPGITPVLLFLSLMQSDIDRAVERLWAEDIEDRVKAAAEIRTLGEACIPALEKAVATSDARLKLVIRGLLHDLSATSSLIEDLKADNVEGNAQAARAKLRQRWNPEIKAALLAAVGGEDEQQAVQAAYLLAVQGEREKILARWPRALNRIARVIVEERDAKFRWVAAEAAVRLGIGLDAAARDAAWSDALGEVHPSRLHEPFLALQQVSLRHLVAMPPPVVRRYLKNLENDDVEGNARQCRYILRRIGPSIASDLRGVLDGSDGQARAMAVDLLLEWKLDVPIEALACSIDWSCSARDRIRSMGKEAVPALLAAMEEPDRRLVVEAGLLIHEAEPGAHDAEMAVPLSRAMAAMRDRPWACDSVAGLLRKLGPSAGKVLEVELKESAPASALAAARALLTIDVDRYAPAVIDRATLELAEDSRHRNAQAAAQLLFELNARAIPRLRELLASDHDQAVVVAAALLSRRGRLEHVPDRVRETAVRYAERQEKADEPGALAEFLTWSPITRQAVLGRLDRTKAACLRVLLAEAEGDPWLSEAYNFASR